MQGCKEINLNTSDGRIELANADDEFPGHCLVINSPTRNNIGIAQYETLAEQNRSLVTFWDVNRHRDLR